MVKIPVLMWLTDRISPKGNREFLKEISSSKIFIL
jgi:hypothetical protein